MSSQQQLEFYQQILMEALGTAKEYSKSELTKDVAKTYLTCIDDLIECINGRHKDFQFDRIHDNQYLFRTIFLISDDQLLAGKCQTFDEEDSCEEFSL